MKPLSALTLSGVLACVCLSAAAGSKPEYTQADLKMLPEYCDDTEGFNHGHRHAANRSPRASKWEAIVGLDFWWLHHYCWGLLSMNRSEQPMAGPGWTKKRHLINARSELIYTIEQVNSKFLLLPEMYTKLGEVEVGLSQVDGISHINGAYSAFLKAREIKPDYWPAYSGWARVLIKSGQKKEAEKLVRTGLENSPDSTVLLELYRSVGGDPAKIVPITKATVAETRPEPAADDLGSGAPQTPTIKAP